MDVCYLPNEPYKFKMPTTHVLPKIMRLSTTIGTLCPHVTPLHQLTVEEILKGDEV